LASGLFGLGKFVIDSVYKSFIVLVLTLYFLSALPLVSDAAARLVPRSRRDRVVMLGGEVMSRIGGYVSGALVVATVAGLSSWLVLGVIGVPYALPLALLIGAADLIPLVGATIGAIVVTCIVLINSVPQALVCAVFFIAYQQLENYFIYPRVMAKTVKVPAALAVVAALLGTALLGVVGALVAVPLAGAVMLIIEEVVIPRQNRS
jgi:predicted PurR-regulated permease PerM